MYISFDSRKKIPNYSISLIDKLNSIQVVNRDETPNSFTQHPCKELANKQTSDGAYTNSGFDRGHLTPLNTNRFSWKAARSSNLLVNIAPQDRITNQQYWKDLELKLAKFLSESHAIVITGVCNNDVSRLGNLNVPSCFWKLVCYKRSSKAVVFGFMHNNTLTKTEEEKRIRKNEVDQLRTFGFIKDKLKERRTIYNWADLWKESQVLIDSRKVNFEKTSFYLSFKEYPSWSDCANAGDFPKELNTEWFNDNKRIFEEPASGRFGKRPRTQRPF
jgi:DNA/RNA endonuclease G (NUC1)